MKKIWIALVVIAMLALLCTVGMITVFAEEGGQETCLHENVQGLYNTDEHWAVCADCKEEWRGAHVFELVALDDERHALACECGRVLPDSIESHTWALAEGENHLSCSECGATTTACVYDQVVYYNDAYHTYACLCGNADSNGLKEAHTVDMTKLQYDDVAHWYGCACGYGAQEKDDHQWGEAWVTDETHHWKECVDCGAKSALAEHSGGTATCQVAAACAECGASYDAGTYTHVTDALIFSKNNTHHSAVYACCGELAVSLARHNFVDSVCVACGYACNHDVVISGAVYTYVSTGNNTHIVVCRNCQMQEEKDCYGGEATCIAKAVCDDCKTEYGEKNPANHVDVSTWATDLTHHWRVCTKNDGCLQVVEGTNEAHTWSEGKCTTCEFECPHNKEDLKYVSNDAHTHDQLCTNCQHVLVDDQEHAWGTDDLSGICTICEYVCQHKESDEVTWMKWHNTDDYHKYICDECGFEDTEKAGNCSDGKEGTTATCIKKADCIVCSLPYGEIDRDNHFDETWVIEVDGHSVICDADKNGCGATIQQKTEHAWVDGVCEIENCKYACLHNGDKTTEVNVDTDTHDVTCDICKKLIVDDDEHKWTVDEEDNSKSKCQVCAAVCDHMSEETSLKVFTNAEKEGVWKHKATCSRCNYVDQEGECAVGETGTAATCLAPAQCGICRLAYGAPDLTKHIWDATTGECTREGCDVVCEHKQVTVTDNQNDDNQHTTTCDTCKYVAAADCSGGKATCMARPLCDECEAPYGEKNPAEHDAELCVRRVQVIPGDTVNHNVYYTCKVDDQQNPVATAEEHDIDETTHVCECGYGWHLASETNGSASDSNTPYQGNGNDLTVSAEQKGDSTAMIIVLSVIGVCAVTVTCVTVSKKKKNHN